MVYDNTKLVVLRGLLAPHLLERDSKWVIRLLCLLTRGADDEKKLQNGGIPGHGAHLV